MQIEGIQPSLGSRLECISSVNSHRLFFFRLTRKIGMEVLSFIPISEKEKESELN